MAPDDEPKVRELLERGALADVIDAATQRELERWFGLPSFQQLDEQQPVDDPGVVAVRERRAKVAALVDPALLERIRVRTQDKPESLLAFAPTIDLRVDPDFGRLDRSMIERASSNAEPRELQRPDDLEDELKECAPQALLRDLHRPEIDFDKTFEVIDMAADQRTDIAVEVRSVLATSWKLPPQGLTSSMQARELLAELRAERRQSWPTLWKSMTLANRRIEE
jgi:hypothetical protein